MDYPFAELRSAVSAMSPPKSLCTPSPFAGGVAQEAGRVLALCKHFCAVPKTFLWYQCCFQHKPKTQSPTMMKTKSIPAKTITSASVPSWQCGEVASSIRKLVLHPSEKLLACFACGLVPMGNKAETIQFIVCKTGTV